MTRAVEEIPALCGVEVEEDARHHYDNFSPFFRALLLNLSSPKETRNQTRTDHLLRQTRMEEVQPIIDCLGQTAQVQPDVERAIWYMVDLESHIEQSPQYVVTLVSKMQLQGFHFFAHELWL